MSFAMSQNDGNITVGLDSSRAEAGLSRLEARFTRTLDRIENYFGRAKGFDRFSRQVDGLTSSMGRLLKVVGGFAIMHTLMGAFQGFVSRLIEVDRVFRGFIASMTVIKGSVGRATQEYMFLLDMSNKLGISVESSISQYHRLAAALKNVDTTGEVTRHVFSGLSQAAVVLHARGRDVTLIFEAVQQMASKGKLSLEELQRQLGNTLPGAVATMAKAMMGSQEYIQKGIKNTAEAERYLREQIEKGTINVYEAILRFANQLKKDYGEGVKYASDQFTANFNRMKNSVFEFYRAVGSSDAMAGLTEVVREITALFNDNDGQGAAGMGQALGSMFRDIAQWISKLESDKIAEFFDVMKVSVEVTGVVVEEFFSVFQGFSGPEMETPLLDFVEFVGTSMAAVVDIFRVAVAGIETAIHAIRNALIETKEFAYNFSDIAMAGSNSFYSMFPGLQSDAEKKRAADYAKMRAGHQQARGEARGALADAAGRFVFGDGTTALERTGEMFEGARTRIVGRRMGVVGYAPYQLPTPSTGGVPSWMTPGANPRKAGSSADAAANYFNPMGDSDLQKLLEEITANSGAPNSGKKPKGRGGGKSIGERAESMFLREQTRMLKELAVAEVEYQNILQNKNRAEGENVAQMRSLLETDERYIALSFEKKARLMEWAKELDDIATKIADATKAQGAMNDALVAGYDAEERIAELRRANMENQYRQEQEVRNSFRKGGENEYMDEVAKQQMISAAMKADADQRNLDMERYAATVRMSNDELEFQAQLIGLSAFEQEKMRQFREIDLQTQRLMVGATIQQQQEYLRLAEILKGDVSEAMDALRDKQRDMMTGIMDAVNKYTDEFSNQARNWGQVTENAIYGMEDALVQFAETGKLSFKELFASIAKDLVRLIVRYLIVFMLQKLTGLGGGGGGGFSGGNLFSGGMTGDYSGIPQIFGGGGLPGYAKGGAFSGGREVEFFAKGGVVSRTTAFGMSNGGMGVMGEKRPEAIMPLARDSSGDLGVKVAGGGGDTVLNLTVEVYQGEGDGVRAEQGKDENGGDVIKIFLGEVAADIRTGGPVHKAISGTFGVNQKPKRYT